MKIKEEKKVREEKNPTIALNTDNQGEANTNDDNGNHLVISKKRQRKELRKITGGDAGEWGAKQKLGEKVREEIRNDIDTARQEIAEAKKAFTPLRKREELPTDGSRGVPVKGIQGGGHSTPEDAPVGAATPTGTSPQGQSDVNTPSQETAQPDEIQPDGFEEPGADTGQGQEPVQGQSPTLPQRVNEQYKDVAADVAPTDSAGASGTEKTTTETSWKTEQEKKDLTEPARQMAEYNNTVMEQAGRDLAAAKERYGMQDTDTLVDGKVKEAEAKKGSPLTARERRKIVRETEREQETRKESIYRELDPNYKDGKAFRREQNIKTIIGAIGQLGKMAGQAVTAANSGIILPTRSFSDGIMNDIRISNKEREQLLKAYDSIRQAKMNEPLARLQEAEKRQLELIKSPAAYQTGKTDTSNKNASVQELKVEKHKEPIPYKDYMEFLNGKKDSNGNKLANNEYVWPTVYDENDMPTGRYIGGIEQFIPGAENLFDDYIALTKNKGEKNISSGINEYKIKGTTFAHIRDLIKRIKGDDGQGKQALQSEMASMMNTLLKDLRILSGNGNKDAQKILDDYTKSMSNVRFEAYKGGGNGDNAGGGQPGTFNQAAVNALQNI